MISHQLKAQIDYWRKSAQKNFAAAGTLFENRHYDGCLFFCHLALEKLLKGLVVRQTKQAAPYIHDLVKLAGSAKLDLSEEMVKNLRIITTFNIAGRYQEVKYAFYRTCTKEYSEKYLKIAQELFLWLKKEYQKK